MLVLTAGTGRYQRDLAGGLVLVRGDFGPVGGEDAEEPVAFCTVRGGGVASKRFTAPVSVPSSIVTCGLAVRLWYQAGCAGAAIAEAHKTMRPGPSLK